MKLITLGSERVNSTQARARQHCSQKVIIVIPELIGTEPLCLLLVDEFHQDTLVLEHIALGLHVQVVVHVVVNLLGLTVFPQQPTQHTHTPDPDSLLGHTGVGRTLALAVAPVTALAPGLVSLADARTAVDNLGFLDDQTILDKFPNVLA